MKDIFDYKKDGKMPEVKKFVLLSKSPRRKELLEFLNPSIYPVEIDEREVEEKFMEIYKNDDFLERCAKTCCEISIAKSKTIDFLENTLYISSDTMVVMDNQIYNKPQNLKQARDMFMSYFGKSHYVVTSVSLRAKGYSEVFYAIAKIEFVKFYEKLEKLIDKYISSKTCLDKAGAYGIQDLDKRFVKNISGDINTIIGMPVAEVSLRIFGK